MKCILVSRHYARQVMLCTVLLLAAWCSKAQLSTLTRPVEVHLTKTNALAVMQELEKQSNYSFSYTASELKKINVEEVHFSKIPLGEALKKLGTLAHLEFRVSATNISVQTALPPAPAVKPDKKRVISGVLKDAKTKQALPNVDVMVQGTRTVTVTDNNGQFNLEVADTSAVLVFSVVGYNSQFVKVGNDIHFAVSLAPDDKALSGVMVEARRRMNTEAAILTERRNSAVVSDGISAQNIEKTASITTVQALQRVTGVTISNDRNVAIRGLGDRNVVAQLNGARLSGANPDQNSPPLDLVPAALLESVVVYKTLTPDKPADATAGIIELKTKAVPDKMTLVLTVQTGTNSSTGIGGSFTSFKGSEPGPFGGQVKKRDLPDAFYHLAQEFPQGNLQLYRYMAESRNTTEDMDRALAIDKMQKNIPAVLMNSYRKAAPNQIYTLGFGNTFKLKGEQRLGLVVSLNYYKRTTEKINSQQNIYNIYQGGPLGQKLIIPPYIDPNNLNLGNFLSYKERTGNEQLNAGGLVTLTYRLNKRHEVSANFMMNQGGEDGATYLNGQYNNTGMPYTISNNVYQLSQSYRTFNTLQLRGEHKLTNGEYALQLSWNVSTSQARQLDPDNRFFSLIADSNVYRGSPIHTPDADQLYFQPLRAMIFMQGVGAINIDPNGRKFRNLDEHNRNYTLDLAFPFKAIGQKQQVKLGGYYLNKERDFKEYILYLPDQQNTGSLANGDLFSVYGNLNAYVAANRIGFLNNTVMEGQLKQVGFLYFPQKTFNNYSGVQRATALYAMADLRLTGSLRVVGGVRMESTTISGTIDTVNASTDPTIYGYRRVIDPVTAYKVKLKPYYSGSLIYTLNQNMNFRLAYVTSLARPELRELMPTLAFDPFQYAMVQGNPLLHNQETSNMDFRWEWFTAPGEVLSVSAFYKKINQQLTRVFAKDSANENPTGATFNIVRYQNDPEQGKVYGLEFEIRKSLQLLNPALRNFFLGTNLMLAHSIIKKNKERLTASHMIDRFASEYSPVFEQPPYAINAYLDYDNKKSGTNATISFNMVGARLVQVRLTGEPDIYDHPAPMLDFVVSQRLAKRIVAKAFVKNILDPAIARYYATPGGNYATFHGHTYLSSSYHQGREIAAGFTYYIF